VPRGKVQEAGEFFPRRCRVKRGQPADPEAMAALQRLIDEERLEALSERLLQVASWQELPATP
jgi:hypothetical protein